MDYTFKKRKYGLFVHFVHGISCRADGSLPENIDQTVDIFDVGAFADAVASMKVEYVIFTAWHFAIRPLYPSAVTQKHRAGNSPRRDLLGEIIDALREKDIEVILYTHPRDGHDLTDAEQKALGWGRNLNGTSTPDPEVFDYKKWNEYIHELYRELLERYGDRISGIYTDGTGPYSFKSERYENTLQVVDYLALRGIIKKKDPKLFMIQNYFGYLFSDDFAMPEGYFEYEKDKLCELASLPAANKALAICPFHGGWWPEERTPRGKDVRATTPRELAKFVIFNASCTHGGGVCLAASPYCEGGLWQVGALETMRELGALLSPLKESLFDAVPSKSYPTVSGDTLGGKSGVCFLESEDGRYEYMHILDSKKELRFELDLPSDGAELFNASSLSEGVTVSEFDKKDGKYLLSLSGRLDQLDTVVRFEREVPIPRKNIEWINDTDKRLRYEGDWSYVHLTQDPATHSVLGSYECDCHVSRSKGSSVFTCFEGDRVEIYANTGNKGGEALVFIDGVRCGSINTKSDTALSRAQVFSSIDLHGGPHTLYIVADADAPVAFDALKIIKQ